MSTLFVDVWVTVYDRNGEIVDADNTEYRRVDSAQEAAEVLAPLGVKHANVATPGPYIYRHGNGSRINFASGDDGSGETCSVSVSGARAELLKLWKLVG